MSAILPFSMSSKMSVFFDNFMSPICLQMRAIKLEVEQLDLRNLMKNTFSQKFFSKNRIIYPFAFNAINPKTAFCRIRGSKTYNLLNPLTTAWFNRAPHMYRAGV